MFDSKEGYIGKELLGEYGNVQEKHDKDDTVSTTIEIVDQCPFPIGNGDGNELDSMLFQETSGSTDHNMNEVLQKELLQYRPSGSSSLLCPLDDSDYSFSLVQVSCSTSMPIENNARTNELDSGSFVLEPVEPNIDVGSLLESRSLNYPIDDSKCAALEDSDEVNLLLQESCTPCPTADEKSKNDQTDLSLDALPDRQESLAEPCSGKGSSAEGVTAKTKGRNYRLKVLQAADRGEGSTVKKQQHNAKERGRRMKLYASYLALGALFPDSSRSKKRKTAPRIISRAVEYIPELEKEIAKLTLMKNNMLFKIKNKKPLSQNPHFQLQDPSVSVHEIKQGEYIIQLYTQRHADDAFSSLLRKVEVEGMCILSASTLQVSDDGVCSHLHIQINGSLNGANRLTSLREKVISCLR